MFSMLSLEYGPGIVSQHSARLKRQPSGIKRAYKLYSILVVYWLARSPGIVPYCFRSNSLKHQSIKASISLSPTFGIVEDSPEGETKEVDELIA